MRVLITSGIWPPDIGGPASHGPEFGGFLASHGHDVRAVAMADSLRGATEPFPVEVITRDRPRALRLARTGLAIAYNAAGGDVIYAAGLYTRSAVVSKLFGLPMVTKLSSDPAYERARSRGLFSGSLAEFQYEAGSGPVRYLKQQRDVALRRASRIVIPSQYLAEVAVRWGVPRDRVRVVPNPAPVFDLSVNREELRARLGIDGPTLVFVGRFVQAKNLPLAIAALARVDRVRLVLVGSGPEAETVAEAAHKCGVQDRVWFPGAVPREDALGWLRAADAAILSSDYENLPHAAVEALALGTPVIATAVGGVPEVIETGVNGLLVPKGDTNALAAAMTSVASDRALVTRLRRGARDSGNRYSAGRIYRRIEQELVEAAFSTRRG